MSLRPSRAVAMAVSLLIVVMMTVWAPAMALADNSSAPSEPPGQSAEPPGKSAEAPGQVAKTETVTTAVVPETPPGNSASAPGQNKTETTTSTTPPTSNAGGNSASNGGGSSNSNAGGSSNSNAGGNSSSNGNSGGNGNNVPASNLNDGVGGGVGNSENQDKDRPKVGNGPGTGQLPADDCTNKHQGADGNKGGANQNPGPYDNTCDGRPSDNGQGGGDAKGRPCMGCVGNADDKNPPGQFPNGASDGNRGNGKGNGRNRGYECDDNNGVGKGNPAHTGCTSGGGGGDPEYDCLGHLLPNDHNHTTAECDPKVTMCHATGSATNPWVIITISRSALAAHQSHPHVDKAAPLSGDADDCDTTIIEYDCAGHAKPNNHSATECDTTEFDCAGHPKPNSHSANECDIPPQFDCAGHPMPNNHSANECQPPIVDCDGDGIDDNVDSDISSCTPPPPAEDCDGDGVPDNLDTDLSACEPTERPEFCPGTTTPMPEDGICDEVLGEIIEKDPKPVFPGGPVVAGEVLGKPEVKAEASVLPFTGGNMLPFLIVSMALMGVGGVSLRRRTATVEEDAA